MEQVVYPVTLDGLLEDGFTKRQALSYMEALEADEKNSHIDSELRRWAHSHGFLAEVAGSLGLNDDNFQLYMSNYEWHKIWPLNDWTRIWINDKMTLKYMLHGTEYGDLMPEYYFYMTQHGLRELVDNPYKGRQDIDALIQLLEDKGSLASKPNNGAFGAGFFALSYENGTYLVNGEKVSKLQLIDLVQKNVNYIYTEFLTPAEPFASIDKSIHTIRVVVMNPEGNSPKILDNITVRFSTGGVTGGNLVHFTSDTAGDAYNMYSHINLSTGEVDKTRLCGLNSYIETDIHPITGVSLKFPIEDFDILKSKLLGVSKYFFGTEWIGFDACVSTGGFKIMEINSHPGCHSAQIFTPLYADSQVKKYLQNKLDQINNMSKTEKVKRSMLLR